MITISSITPNKNAYNVHINEDVNIKINADFKLDPRNISFKINEVDVVPNTFSVYNPETNTAELDVTLYVRRRIKYKTNRRYGQEDLRYGMRDNFPSMFQYNSRYVIEFTVWGTNSNNIEERITDRFVFTTEPGVFSNERPDDYYYSEATQGIANYFPEWSKSRFDKFSNLQQLMNPIGIQLEKVQDFVTKQSANNFLQTANLKQLPYLHKIELGKDFDIKSNLNQDRSLFYIQPDISGIQGITRYDLYTSQSNNINSAFYEAYPSRIDSERTVIDSNLLHGPTLATETSQLIEKKLSREGAVCIKASNVGSSIYRNERGNILFVKCRIHGKNPFSIEQTEDIVLLNDREISSNKSWSYIQSIEFFNLNNQKITFELKIFKSPLAVIQDKKFTTTFEDNREPVLWKAEKINTRTVLQKHITTGDNALELLRNAGETKPIQEYELLDIDNASSLDLIDIAIDSFSNKIYGVDEEFLYIFDKHESYPERLKEIPGDNGSSDFLIELDSDEMGLDEDGQKEILFKLVHKSPGSTIVRYRVRMKKPDGTEIFLRADGSQTLDMNEASIIVKQKDIQLEDKQYSFIADQVGDYIIELETIYRKGQSSRHRQLVRVLTKKAQIKYKLERILNEEKPVSLFFDYDQKLKLLTDRNSVYTINFHYDGVIIDYDSKILYFIEEYESVDIE
ncbi:MAG: hypothetical protein PHY47_00320 [Lachnospiraceae bacterium]|nr:hypothetical protein [Lachnospiraceae bacterium]